MLVEFEQNCMGFLSRGFYIHFWHIDDAILEYISVAEIIV